MFLPELFNLGHAYKQYFQVVPALTDALRDQVYRIRHAVYCEDLQFEQSRPDGREFDLYDAQSLHLLIRSVKSGEFVGCTRIICTAPADPAAPLPFEIACTETLDRTLVDPASLPRNSIAEVSRLAVIAKFRRRKRDDKANSFSITDSDFSERTEQPRFPYIPIALYLGTIELARLHRIKTLFVLTERRLATHFKRLGVNIQGIGGPIEHRGERVPSMLDIEEIITNMKAIARPLYRVIADEVSACLAPPLLP